MKNLLKFATTFVIVVSFGVSLYAIPKEKTVSTKPNILVIFTDDQGYGDLGCYGNKKIKTPRLDRIAEEGTRFTSFYAQPVCGPSRSALLTGRYPVRSKGWNMPAEEITFAELLKSAGYQIACLGKWDVTSRKPIFDRMPFSQGFDYYFGTLVANEKYIIEFYENNRPAGETKDKSVLTRLYTDKAIDFLENRRNPKKPFLLYLAHNMMHTIVDASERFKGTSDGGLYGDVVEEFDYETGRLLDKLEALGLSDNTLVIYTTDNGPWCQPAFNQVDRNATTGHPEGSVFWGDPGPLRGGKGSAYEAGSRVPCIVRWPGKVPAGRVSDAIFATIDFFPTFASLAEAKLPTDRVIDGIDQSAMLLGGTEEGRITYFYDQHPLQTVGIRQENWKLLLPGRKPENGHRYLMDFGTNDYELYNLDKDMGEKKNLADKHPEIVKELINELENFKSTCK